MRYCYDFFHLQEFLSTLACTIVERGVISQIELLCVLICLDNLTEEFSIIFLFKQNLAWLFVTWKFRTHIILEQNVIFTKQNRPFSKYKNQRSTSEYMNMGNKAVSAQVYSTI